MVRQLIGVQTCVQVCVLALAGGAAAQPANVTVRGTVVDETGAPIAGASILFGDQAAVTDDAGAFVVTGRGMLTVIVEGRKERTRSSCAHSRAHPRGQAHPRPDRSTSSMAS